MKIRLSWHVLSYNGNLFTDKAASSHYNALEINDIETEDKMLADIHLWV